MIHPTAFIHDKALVDAGARIGARTRVWGFSHVLAGARIGADCNTCEQVFIENDVIVGDRVTFKRGVQLWDGLRVGDDVHIGPNVTFTNDKYPMSRNSGYTCLPTHIEAGASIGGGAVILPGLTIGAGAMVGAGAVVTHSVPPGVTVVGNPARVMPGASPGTLTATPALPPASPGTPLAPSDPAGSPAAAPDQALPATT